MPNRHHKSIYSEPKEQRAIVPFADLSELSGRTRPSAVKKWVQARGILYFLDADGRRCTTTRALNDALMSGRKTEPNWHVSRK